MNQVIAQYPNSRLSEMAGMIVNGVNAGRRLYGGKFDLSNVWAKRSDVLSSQDSTQQKGFSADRNDRLSSCSPTVQIPSTKTSCSSR